MSSVPGVVRPDPVITRGSPSDRPGSDLCTCQRSGWGTRTGSIVRNWGPSWV